MNDASHHIRLVAGFEIRPPTGNCRFVFERDEAERLGALIGEDLAHCVPEATTGHLVTGPALLEPGQVISPGHAPWDAMVRLAGLANDPEPGITSIGAREGRLAHAPLMPYWTPPRGLFVCLPIMLAAAPDRLEALSSKLEQTLFESGGLRPPAMGTLAEITGLDPVHGQLMTRADLMALVKVQLAGAGLDPFWPPVEHALLEPHKPARLELPAGLVTNWNIEAAGWELQFESRHTSSRSNGEFALWLRAMRQTVALLESHLVRWRAVGRDAGVEIDEQSRWARCDLGPAEPSNSGWMIQHPEVGLVAYTAVIDGRYNVFYPLEKDALEDLDTFLRAAGVQHFERSGLEGLHPTGGTA